MALNNTSQCHTIPSISVDVSKVGHGITETREASSSLNRPHKLKITLQWEIMNRIRSLG